MFPVCPLCCFILISMDLESEINDDDDDEINWSKYNLFWLAVADNFLLPNWPVQLLISIGFIFYYFSNLVNRINMIMKFNHFTLLLTYLTNNHVLLTNKSEKNHLPILWPFKYFLQIACKTSYSWQHFSYNLNVVLSANFKIFILPSFKSQICWLFKN